MCAFECGCVLVVSSLLFFTVYFSCSSPSLCFFFLQHTRVGGSPLRLYIERAQLFRFLWLAHIVTLPLLNSILYTQNTHKYVYPHNITYIYIDTHICVLSLIGSVVCTFLWLLCTYGFSLRRHRIYAHNAVVGINTGHTERYVHTHIYVYVCVFVCVVWIVRRVCTFERIKKRMCVCTYMYICIYKYICTHFSSLYACVCLCVVCAVEKKLRRHAHKYMILNSLLLSYINVL